MPAAPPLALSTDPVVAYPELTVLRAAVRLGDWPTVRATLANREPSVRTALIRLSTRSVERPGALAALLDADPSDALAAALYGDHLINEAWKVRTAAAAQYVSREQFDRFHEILRDAERVLIDAAAYNPGDPAIWTLRLLTARGLGLGQSEARRRYDRLARHDPHHLPAQRQLLQQLCPKWGGSFDETHAFARSAMLAAPVGAYNAVLVVEAHVERMLELDGAEHRRYPASPEVRAEIREAATRSVLHPAFRRTVGWVAVQNSFALMLTLIEDYQQAAWLFHGLGNLVDEDAWGYFGDPVAKFEEFRQRAYQKASGQ